MLRRHAERGDTLIEVLFAVTVFSLIVVTALSLMNQGLAAAQRSLEITQVREQIDGQAETLRFMHDSYVAAYQSGSLTGAAKQWSNMMAGSAVTAASQFGNNASGRCQTPPAKAFVVDPKAALYVSQNGLFAPTTTTSQLKYNASNVVTQSQGLWIEAVRSQNSADANQQNSGYVDFHIRACWDAPGLNASMNIGTIVRLYEPR